MQVLLFILTVARDSEFNHSSSIEPGIATAKVAPQNFDVLRGCYSCYIATHCSNRTPTKLRSHCLYISQERKTKHITLQTTYVAATVY